MPIPAHLSAPVEVPTVPEVIDTMALRALYRQTLVRLTVANGKLIEIGALGNEHE